MKKIKDIFAALTARERITFILSAVVLILALASFGIILFRENTQLAPAKGGSFTEGVVGQPVYANPVLASSEIDKSLVKLLFAPVTDLAEKIESDKNGLIWNVRLKEGLVWSDKHKLTSDDAIFTIQRLQDPESPYAASWRGVSVQRASELEFTITLSSAYPGFGDNLKNLFIIPKHLFAETPTAHWQISAYVLKKPVSSGPYVFRSMDSRDNGFIDSYSLTENDAYSGKHPYIAELNFNFYPNKDDLLRAFNSGRVDGIADLDPTIAKSVTRPYKLTAYQMPSYYGVFFNQTQNLALKDDTVRKALDMSVDRDRVVRDILGGQALNVTSPILNYDSGITFDPEAAKSALDAAGWQAGDNGIRSKAINKNTSIPLEFKMVVPDIGFLRQVAEEVQNDWKNVGAQVDIAYASPEDLTSRTINNRDYESILFGNILNPPFDLYPFWDSNERFYPGLNLSMFNSRQADQLIDEIRSTSNSDTIQSDLAKLGQTIAQNHPAAILFSPKFIQLTSKDVNGLSSGFILDPSDRFSSASDWYVRTARTFK